MTPGPSSQARLPRPTRLAVAVSIASQHITFYTESEQMNRDYPGRVIRWEHGFSKKGILDRKGIYWYDSPHTTHSMGMVCQLSFYLSLLRKTEYQRWPLGKNASNRAPVSGVKGVKPQSNGWMWEFERCVGVAELDVASTIHTRPFFFRAHSNNHPT